MLLVFPFYALVGHSYHGAPGFVGAFAAGVVCWLGAMVALLVAGISKQLGGQIALQGLLFSMVFRMGVPFVAGMLLNKHPAFEGTGVFGLIVGYYLFALVVEAPLSVVVGSASESEAAHTETKNQKVTGAS